MMRLLDCADFGVMYKAEKESDKDLFLQFDLTEEEYVRIASKYPSVGFEIDGENVGGMFVRAGRIHLSVMPEYHGKWGWLFTPAFKWAFSLSDPLYAYVSRENEKVLRFIRRHDWKQVNEIDSTVIFELTDLTTRYPK
jgi:GNAT superfamily N-acetyltransferase